MISNVDIILRRLMAAMLNEGEPINELLRDLAQGEGIRLIKLE